MAAEAALLPVAAVFFGRVTLAGLLLNFAAIPLMSLLQAASLATLAASAVSDTLFRAGGYVTHLSAAGIIESARLTDVAAWPRARRRLSRVVGDCDVLSVGADRRPFEIGPHLARGWRSRRHRGRVDCPEPDLERPGAHSACIGTQGRVSRRRPGRLDSRPSAGRASHARRRRRRRDRAIAGVARVGHGKLRHRPKSRCPRTLRRSVCGISRLLRSRTAIPITSAGHRRLSARSGQASCGKACPCLRIPGCAASTTSPMQLACAGEPSRQATRSVSERYESACCIRRCRIGSDSGSATRTRSCSTFASVTSRSSCPETSAGKGRALSSRNSSPPVLSS